MVIKNYKLMCELLDEDVKAGNSKKYQIIEWERYFKFHKQGNSFVIDEIYLVANDKVDGRGGTSEYSDAIQNLLMDLLAINATTNNDLIIMLGVNKLLERIKLVSVNYGYCRDNTEKLATFLEMKNDFVSEFYDYNHKNLKRNLETALNQLKKKSLIQWTQEKVVVVENIEAERNELGDICLKDIDMENYNYLSGKNSLDRIQYKITTTHRQATAPEVEIILQTEKEVLIDMGIATKQGAYLSGQWSTYIKKINSKLHKKANILFAYDAYKMIINRDYILEEYADMQLMQMTDVERNINQTKINNQLSDGMLENAEGRREKLISKNQYGIPKNNNKKAQVSKNYISNTKQLIDILINKNAEDVTKEVRNTKIIPFNYIGGTLEKEKSDEFLKALGF
ncbi:hypothetical protein K2F43_00855 [Clostridium estertheticum]|uniref:hypothetical protein n=1 Tax=Clostridium estertheticum TaxID=238834 RepID=UPI001C6E87F3|nr:hypothetical protein [Clostridium estertheticum]MBW9169750.1 hypothetical protein [Clostridium estertheticum]WLC74744.1 hypothetical protein KTC99_18610 [Clostridium estertheticum]